MKPMQSVHLVPANGRLGGAECFEPTTTFRGTVLLIHGGGWSSLDSSSLHGVALDLQEAGFGVLTANYRKIPRAPWPACLEDVHQAAAWLLERHDRIAVAGASAGGHLAVRVALELPPARVSAVVSLCGPSALGNGPSEEDPQLFSSGFLDQFFGHPGDHREEIRLAEPFPLIRAGLPDLLCVHSLNDRLVTPDHSRNLVAAWREAGNQSSLYTFAGEGTSHGLWLNPDAPLHRRRLRQDVYRRLTAFLDQSSPPQTPA